MRCHKPHKVGQMAPNCRRLNRKIWRAPAARARVGGGQAGRQAEAARAAPPAAVSVTERRACERGISSLPAIRLCSSTSSSDIASSLALSSRVTESSRRSARRLPACLRSTAPSNLGWSGGAGGGGGFRPGLFRPGLFARRLPAVWLRVRQGVDAHGGHELAPPAPPAPPPPAAAARTYSLSAAPS